LVKNTQEYAGQEVWYMLHILRSLILYQDTVEERKAKCSHSCLPNIPKDSIQSVP